MLAGVCVTTALIGLSFFFSSRRRHTRLQGDWSSDVCSSDLLRFQEMDPKQADFSVVVHPDFRRQGYASEAVSGLLSFAFDALRLHRLIAVCDSRNQAARGLVLREGLRLEGEFVKSRLVNEEWINTLSFGLVKEEFDAWSKTATPS